MSRHQVCFFVIKANNTDGLGKFDLPNELLVEIPDFDKAIGITGNDQLLALMQVNREDLTFMFMLFLDS